MEIVSLILKIKCPGQGHTPGQGYPITASFGRSKAMGTRCEIVDWFSWTQTEAASRILDLAIAFSVGHWTRRGKPRPPKEIKPLPISGGIHVNINPVLSGKASLGR